MSSRTIDVYSGDLHALRDYCDSHGIKRWTQLRSEHVRQLCEDYRRLVTRASVRRRASVVRKFLDYLVAEGGLSTNCAAQVMYHESAFRQPKTITPDQVARLLDARAAGPLTEQDIRDLAIAEVIYSSGLRSAEVAALNLPDLNFTDGTVLVQGRGGKQRIVPMGRQAMKALRLWLVVREPYAVDDPQAVFISTNTCDNKRMNQSAVSTRVREWGQRQGLPVPINATVLRSSCATHMLEAGADICFVQEMLGHASLITTQVYARTVSNYVAGVYERAHPRAKRNPQATGSAKSRDSSQGGHKQP